MARAKPLVTIREQIADSLRSDIIAGNLKPGERVREEVLADKFGVSRGPIRDVLLQLNKEGLLSSKPNCGVTVNHQLAPGLHSLMKSLRLKIEVDSLKLLKGKLVQEDFETLSDIVDNLHRALKAENFTEATEQDLAFHRYLVRKAGGDDLVNVWTSVALRMRIDYQRISKPKESYDEHKAIVSALEAGNMKKAADALKANIR